MKHVLAIAIALSLVTVSASAQELSEDDIKRLALEAILENPEIIMEAVAILDQRARDGQAANIATVLQDQRDLLINDPNAPVLGNPDGDVTVVEFFDYNCPYCKRAMPEVEALIESDPNVRVVYREWPILGEGSVFAARAALAARVQGNYDAFHWALMGQPGRIEEPVVLRIAAEVGLNVDRMLLDMDSAEIDEHLATSNALATALGFGGTPSFVIGDALLPGFVELSALEQGVAKARAAAQ
ncbi:MAG: DsbA family protein [Paracoccaceae bacterium]|nr:DsbA family protein [Paracoccaceae bacterium]